MKHVDIPFCCACGKVQDNVQSPSAPNQWIDLRSYNMKNGFHLTDIHLVNTYCPECFRFFENVFCEKTLFPGVSQGA